ncbi:ferritin [Ezakiella coagulans]|uniref:ferritin n=1 Tax=Ezakiella coagulans TaxID=46507 RepID=UPI0028897067|nr:ferritin [Ezakiella coagulans]
MISERLAKAINEQLNFELASGFIYKGMEAYFGKEGYDGFKHFMKLQAEEEYEHHQKFAEFLYSVDKCVEYTEIPGVKNEYKSPKDAIEQALGHEQEVTKRIHNLYQIALEEKDYEAITILDWFLNEQVEEEDNFRHILDQYELLDDAKTTTYWIDKELGKRQ